MDDMDMIFIQNDLTCLNHDVFVSILQKIFYCLNMCGLSNACSKHTKLTTISVNNDDMDIAKHHLPALITYMMLLIEYDRMRLAKWRCNCEKHLNCVHVIYFFHIDNRS